jgi:hypothetical protein
MKHRKSYLYFDDYWIELRRKPICVYGYSKRNKYVCRLDINSAGIAVHAGKKGGRILINVNWERLVKILSKPPRQ